MSKNIVLKIILFNLIGLLILFCLGLFLIPTSTYTKMIKGFYEEPKNTLDVVLFGDSSIYKGVSPLEMWKEYGITGYDFATPTQRVWDSYFSMKEVLQYQKPKVMVLDVNEFFKETPMKVAYKSHLYDNMRYGGPKMEAIMAPVEKNSIQKKISFVFPVLRFHSRWNELEEADFADYDETYTNVFKGFSVVKREKSFNRKDFQQEEDNNVITENVLQYLSKIKKLTKENNVKFVLIAIPNPKTFNDERKEAIKRWSKENKVQFINMNNSKKIKIDWKKDTGDEGSHLNINGARKVSKYLGKCLRKKYKLKDQRKDKKCKKWNEDLKKYENYINSD